MKAKPVIIIIQLDGSGTAETMLCGPPTSPVGMVPASPGMPSAAGLTPKAGALAAAISPEASGVVSAGKGDMETRDAGNAAANTADSRNRAGSALRLGASERDVSSEAERRLFVCALGRREPGEEARMMEIGSTLAEAEAEATSDRGIIVAMPIAETPAIAARVRYSRRLFGVILILTATLTRNASVSVEI